LVVGMLYGLADSSGACSGGVTVTLKNHCRKRVGTSCPR